MIKIRFDDEAIERKALGWLAGRFSFRTFSTGVTLVPEYALPFLAREGFKFSVEGPASYEQIISAIRNPPAAAVQ
jgi:hypothetical protein